MESEMEEKDFLRQMEELLDFGRAKENVLTKEEINSYCEDMSLTGEQMEFVYAYLTEHHIQVAGFSNQEPVREEAEENPVDSKYLRIYRKELRALPNYGKEEMELLYEKLRNGEEEAIEKVIEAHLGRIVTIAGRFRGRGVPLEDLIQEGNLELMTCVSMLCGNREIMDYKEAIDYTVKNRLTELVDGELEDSNYENSVLARVNLLLEATRTLAEEYGRIATMEELSEFTRMDRDEIEMYVELSRGKIEIGKG